MLTCCTQSQIVQEGKVQKEFYSILENSAAWSLPELSNATKQPETIPFNLYLDNSVSTRGDGSCVSHQLSLCVLSDVILRQQRKL